MHEITHNIVNVLHLKLDIYWDLMTYKQGIFLHMKFYLKFSTFRSNYK